MYIIKLFDKCKKTIDLIFFKLTFIFKVIKLYLTSLSSKLAED